MMQIAIKDIKVESNFDAYVIINKNIEEQENSGEPYLIILFENFYFLMDIVKMYQKQYFNGKVVELLNLLLIECRNIDDKIKDKIPEDKQQLEKKEKSLEKIINKNINFINFSEKNINNLYFNIRNSLQAIYEKKYLYIINFYIDFLIQHITDSESLIKVPDKKKENIFNVNEKKLTNLSKSFDQNFFNDLNFNNNDIKNKIKKKEGESYFYREQKIKINDIEYQQMIIPGDGNCLLYSIFAHFNSFAYCKDSVLKIYTATEESKKNANIFRENLLVNTLASIDFVGEQLNEEKNQNKKEELNIILFSLYNIANDLSVPQRDIDINCLMIIAKYFEVDICLYIKTNNSFLYFNKKGNLPKYITEQEFNQKDGIKLIIINNNHYELLKKQES